MERKAIELAKKTLVLSMPNVWVKKNNIQKGDSLEVEEEENRLIISAKSTTRKADRIEINAEDLGYFDPNYAAYLYQAGIDEARISYKDPKTYGMIQKKMYDLMGFEVTDQGEHYVEIKSVSLPLLEEFDTILRRTFHIVEELGKSSLEAIKEKDYERLESLLPLENSIDKFTDFCKRLLNKKGYIKYSKTQFYYTIVRDLEKAGDFYEDMINSCIERNSTPGKETLELYEEANRFFSLFHQLFYKFTPKEAILFHEKRKSLTAKAGKLMKTSQKEDLLMIYNLSGLIKLLGDLYGPYYLTMI